MILLKENFVDNKTKHQYNLTNIMSFYNLIKQMSQSSTRSQHKKEKTLSFALKQKSSPCSCIRIFKLFFFCKVFPTDFTKKEVL